MGVGALQSITASDRDFFPEFPLANAPRYLLCAGDYIAYYSPAGKRLKHAQIIRVTTNTYAIEKWGRYCKVNVIISSADTINF